MEKDKTTAFINPSQAWAIFAQQLVQPKKDLEAGKGTKFSYRYASLDSVTDSIRNAMKGTGMSFSQFIQENENGQEYVYTKVRYGNGEDEIFKGSKILVQKQDMQGLGSGQTYARRYSLSLVFGIAPADDDDGKASINNGNQSNPQHNAPSNQPQAPCIDEEKQKMLWGVVEQKADKQGKKPLELWNQIRLLLGLPNGIKLRNLTVDQYGLVLNKLNEFDQKVEQNKKDKLMNNVNEDIQW
jgi:hypothetical protein